MTGIKEFGAAGAVGPRPSRPTPNTEPRKPLESVVAALDFDSLGLIEATTDFVAARPTRANAESMQAVVELVEDRLRLARVQLEMYAEDRRAMELITLAKTARNLAGPNPGTDQERLDALFGEGPEELPERD